MKGTKQKMEATLGCRTQEKETTSLAYYVSILWVSRQEACTDCPVWRVKCCQFWRCLRSWEERLRWVVPFLGFRRKVAEQT